MNIFHNRPLALATCLSALAAVLMLRFSPFWQFLLLLLLLALLFASCVLLVAWRKKERLKRILFLLSLCLVCASVTVGSSYAFFQVHYANAQALVGEEVTIRGTVRNRVSSTSYSGLFEVRVQELNGEPMRMKLLLETTYPSALQRGDAFTAKIVPRSFENSADFEERSYRLSNGYLLAAVCERAEDCEINYGEGQDMMTELSAWNARLSSRISGTIGGEEGALTAALLLGNRDLISPDTALDFSRTGTTHLLALSGSHIVVLLGFFEFFLRRIRTPKLIRAILLPSVAGGYLALTGFAASNCRAVLMVAILYFGFLLKEEYDSFTALCVALALMLTVTPYAVLDLAMWLSFLSTGGIVIFMPAFFSYRERILNKKGWLPYRIKMLLLNLLGAVLVGVAANFALVLLIAIFFGELSLLAIPATLVMSLPTTWTLMLALLTLLLPGIPLLPTLCRLSSHLLLQLAAEGEEMKHILIPLGDKWTQGILLLMTALLVALAVLRIKRKLWYVLPLALFVAAIGCSFGVTYLPSNASITCVQAGDGMSCVFSERGSAVAVDLSDGSARAAVALTTALYDARCTELEDLILTRYINGQSAYLYRLAGAIRVRTLHLPPPNTVQEEEIAARLCEEAERHGITVLYGCEDVALSSMEVVYSSHESARGTSAAGVLFFAKLNGVGVTCMNLSSLMTSLQPTVERCVGQSRYLMVAQAGMTAQNQALIPIASASLEEVVVQSDRLVLRIPGGDHGFRVHPSVEKIRFFTKESFFFGDEKRLFFIGC